VGPHTPSLQAWRHSGTGANPRHIAPEPKTDSGERPDAIFSRRALKIGETIIATGFALKTLDLRTVFFSPVLARRLLRARGALKAAIWRKWLIPFLGRRNWRPAQMVPLGRDYLRANFGFDEEPLVKAAALVVRDNTMASFERLATLWLQVRYLDRYNIPGSLVECGVWRGGCAGLMALAHLCSHRRPFREIHLFDSFQGLPQPDRKIDGTAATRIARGNANGLRVPINRCVAELEQSRKLLIDNIGYPGDLVRFHVGWFQDTIPNVSTGMGPVALMRLDGDWYESTIIPLRYLYEKVSAAGVIVVDDYGHFEGCRKAVDEFIQSLERPILLNHIDYTGRFWLKSDPPPQSKD